MNALASLMYFFLVLSDMPVGLETVLIFNTVCLVHCIRAPGRLSFQVTAKVQDKKLQELLVIV